MTGESTLRPEKRKLVKLVKAEKIAHLRAQWPTKENGTSVYGYYPGRRFYG